MLDELSGGVEESRFTLSTVPPFPVARSISEADAYLSGLFLPSNVAALLYYH